MENKIFTKIEKLTAKKNFLALEANYRFVKKLANKSSKDADYFEIQSAQAKSFLSGYNALGPNFKDKIFTAKWIKDENGNYNNKYYYGYIPNLFAMQNLNKVYYCIKHNKIEELSKCYHGTEITNYIINPETNIIYQFID